MRLKALLPLLFAGLVLAAYFMHVQHMNTLTKVTLDVSLRPNGIGSAVFYNDSWWDSYSQLYATDPKSGQDPVDLGEVQDSEKRLDEAFWSGDGSLFFAVSEVPSFRPVSTVVGYDFIRHIKLDDKDLGLLGQRGGRGRELKVGIQHLGPMKLWEISQYH